MYKLNVFKDQEAVKCFSSFHDGSVVVPLDKLPDNIVYAHVSDYYELIKEVGINEHPSNPITKTLIDKHEIWANQK